MRLSLFRAVCVTVSINLGDLSQGSKDTARQPVDAVWQTATTFHG
jgi:hypothetical protein